METAHKRKGRNCEEKENLEESVFEGPYLYTVATMGSNPLVRNGVCSYGLIIKRKERCSWQMVGIVPDVASEREMAKEIADYCNNNKVKPASLLEVMMCMHEGVIG